MASALCTRADPTQSVHILPSRTSDIDPRLSPRQRAEKDFAMGMLKSNATNKTKENSSSPCAPPRSESA
jgi:hypothetical protein